MAPWYLLQRRTVLYGEGSLARGLIYLAGLWILFIVASSQGYIETWVLLALGPQCFLAVPFRWAVGAIVVLNATPVMVALVTGAGARRADLARRGGASLPRRSRSRSAAGCSGSSPRATTGPA